jgi:hypothetical protein
MQRTSATANGAAAGRDGNLDTRFRYCSFLFSFCGRRHVFLFYSIMVARVLRHDRVWRVNVGESRGVG